jgi:GntR family histidine utilization transcriptional repressor
MSSLHNSIQLSGDKSVPVYQQIKDAVQTKIKSGQWQAGMMIPSENQLAENLNASRMTINRSLRELTAQGVLHRRHGLGTFVAEPPRHAHLVEVVSIADEIAQQGKQHSSKLLSVDTVDATIDMSKRMQVPESTKIFKVVLVHLQDGVPIQIEIRHVNPTLVPDFLQVDFKKTTPAEHLISSIRPDELEHIVQAIMPNAFIAEHLDIPTSEPCLKLMRRTFKDHHVVTAVDLIYPSSRYDLGARYAPPVK